MKLGLVFAGIGTFEGVGNYNDFGCFSDSCYDICSPEACN